MRHRLQCRIHQHHRHRRGRRRRRQHGHTRIATTVGVKRRRRVARNVNVLVTLVLGARYFATPSIHRYPPKVTIMSDQGVRQTMPSTGRQHHSGS